MPCYHPREARRSETRNDRGKYAVWFPRAGWRPGTGERLGVPITLPCGQCIGCRLSRARTWGIRGMHESQMHKENSFITLTYRERDLPYGGSLSPKDIRDFMKRLRTWIFRKYGSRVRFLYCGEYGEQRGRPHYHIALFGFQFRDLKPWRKKGGYTLYRSKDLEKLWTMGNCEIGEVTFESVSYVARYICKKVTGKGQDEIDPKTGLRPYEKIDATTGEVIEIEPEFVRMSLKPGLGHDWFVKFKEDVYPADEIVLRGGQKVKPPAYYDSLLARENPELLEKLKQNRKARAEADPDNTSERLAIRELVQEFKMQKLIRELESS